MDLGCLDLGCISLSDKHNSGSSSSTETVLDHDNNDSVSGPKLRSASKAGKNKSPRGTGQSTSNVLSKFSSQIKKPPHRKTSPINWFPRKKVDSYLKRKIKMLQEVDGMNLTLDETLGDSNPHYSRVLREQIAAREAAHKAMEARKAALVEASWCRILQAARIKSKEAEELLLKAEKIAAEAFEAATAMGVIMYDKPNCPKKPSQVETSSVNGGRSTTHTITASFETAFEVDKKVAAAVKSALFRLAKCPAFNNGKFMDVLRKISQNPDIGYNSQEFSEFSSDCESESGSEFETISQNDGSSSHDLDSKLPILQTRDRKTRRRKSLEKFSMTKLVDVMLERLRCLKEDELSSLATIVATCGLNAALAEVESSKPQDVGSIADDTSSQDPSVSRRMSSAGAGGMGYSNLQHFLDGKMRKKQVEAEIPSLDKFLVKHMSKLEREVQEAKNSRRHKSSMETQENTDKIDDEKNSIHINVTSSKTIPDLGSILMKHSSKLEKEVEEAKKKGKDSEIFHKKPVTDLTSSEAIPDLGSILVKHSSNLEKEVQEMRRNIGKTLGTNGQELGRAPNGAVRRRKEDSIEVPSLDKLLVKHVSRLEKEVQEAKNRRRNYYYEEDGVSNMKTNSESSAPESQSENNFSFDGDVGKENYDVKKENFEPVNLTAKAGKNEAKESLDNILVKPVHRLEREKMQAALQGSNYVNRLQKKCGNVATDCEGLEKVLVKHVSRLEKEKMELGLKQEEMQVKKRGGRYAHVQKNEEGGLEQNLIKHKSRLEKEKIACAEQPGDQIRLSVSRREARERQLQEAWGGLSLGNSIRPHLSRLERDKAAWIKAEEEERRRAMKGE